MALYGDKRIVWARNATVAFARGIQQRLSRPGAYTLADRYVPVLYLIDINLYSTIRKVGTKWFPLPTLPSIT